MDALPTAHLDLPEQGYLDWLRSQPLSDPVAVRPSSAHNPLAIYLYEVIGIKPRLHTDGTESWFILGLTRDDRASLRMILPPWTAPLVASYTMHRPVWHGPDPAQSTVVVARALDDAGDRGLIPPPSSTKPNRRKKST